MRKISSVYRRKTHSCGFLLYVLTVDKSRTRVNRAKWTWNLTSFASLFSINIVLLRSKFNLVLNAKETERCFFIKMMGDQCFLAMIHISYRSERLHDYWLISQYSPYSYIYSFHWISFRSKHTSRPHLWRYRIASSGYLDTPSPINKLSELSCVGWRTFKIWDCQMKNR